VQQSKRVLVDSLLGVDAAGRLIRLQPGLSLEVSGEERDGFVEVFSDYHGTRVFACDLIERSRMFEEADGS
jgi:hypothetical protein